MEFNEAQQFAPYKFCGPFQHPLLKCFGSTFLCINHNILTINILYKSQLPMLQLQQGYLTYLNCLILLFCLIGKCKLHITYNRTHQN